MSIGSKLIKSWKKEGFSNLRASCLVSGDLNTNTLWLSGKEQLLKPLLYRLRSIQMVISVSNAKYIYLHS